jgi:hypothetical protein
LRSARGGATLPVAVERRRGCVGRFAPLPDVGRALREAAGPDRAGALRGAAVRRFADDGAAGFRPALFAVAALVVAPFAVAALVVAPFAVAALVAPPFAVPPFAVPPWAVEPFAVPR